MSSLSSVESPVGRPAIRSIVLAIVGAFVVSAGPAMLSAPAAVAADTRVPAGQVLQISVPEAIGGKTVVGQLAVDNAAARGFVTAYGCADGLPLDVGGAVSKSDLNYDGGVAGVWSNRLIVQADSAGEICLFTQSSVDMIVDVNGVSFDTGITSFPNRRTDTRTGMNTARNRVAPGGVLRIRVPEAVGGKTVIGQLTVDRVIDPGFVTAFGCDAGVPRGGNGDVTKSDLNYDPRVGPNRSNRLIVQADDSGDVCFYSSRLVDLIIDVNGVADQGITSFANRRTDTRTGSTTATLAAGEVLRVAVPEAMGAKTVIGQLTVSGAKTAGFVTAFGCDDGLPQDDGDIAKSDLNYDGTVAANWSNRLIVRADADGEICLFPSSALDVVIDVNAVALDIAIYSFPNRRVDTREGTRPPPTSVPADSTGRPVWPKFTPASGTSSVGALTGLPVDAATASRPILAVKIDNFRLARPQFGLEYADAIIEENVEGVTRFIALYQTRLPVQVGPVRSARTSDLDLLSGMNRPVFGYSGANAGVTEWIRSAASSGVLVDFSGLRSPCYSREPTRPAPHNLILDAPCAISATRSAAPGRAGALWAIDPTWTATAPIGPVPDTTFTVAMDGVQVAWTWDPTAGSYRRSQNGAVHVTASGSPVRARNVVQLVATHVPSPVDARSPHPITVGGGQAIIHRAGVAIRGTWSRATAVDPFVFRDAITGSVVPLDAGKTVIELTRAL